MLRVHTGPTWSAEWFHNREGVVEDGGSDQLWGKRGNYTQGCNWVEEWNHGHLHREHIGPLSVHGPNCFSTQPLGQESWCREREKYTLKGNRSRWCMNLRASAPATWDQTPSPIGQWLPFEKRRSLFNTQLCLKSLHSSPKPYQGDSHQHTLRKNATSIRVKTSSPTKGIGHTQSS